MTTIPSPFTALENKIPPNALNALRHRCHSIGPAFLAPAR